MYTVQFKQLSLKTSEDKEESETIATESCEVCTRFLESYE